MVTFIRIIQILTQLIPYHRHHLEDIIVHALKMPIDCLIHGKQQIISVGAGNILTRVFSDRRYLLNLSRFWAIIPTKMLRYI